MFSKLESVSRWLGPATVAIVLMTLYQLFVSPTIRDMTDDWTFLHAARLQVIQQQIQANQKVDK